jgi:diguanylate cyclase (GGDEF)-like protein
VSADVRLRPRAPNLRVMDERSLRHVVLGLLGVLGLGAAALASHHVSSPAGFLVVSGFVIAAMYGAAALMLGWFAVRRGSARHLILTITFAMTAGAYALLSVAPHGASATYMWATAHIVLPIGLVLALLGGPKVLRDAFAPPSTRLRGTLIAGGYVAAILAILYLAPQSGRLPTLDDPTQLIPLGALVVLVSAVAVGLGLRRGRREDLESWLTVVAAANLVDGALTIGAHHGGTVGALVARIVAMVASLAMLRAVMQDAGRLWAKLGSARFSPLDDALGILDEDEILERAHALMPTTALSAPLSVVMFALDGLDTIYDDFGHLTGDRVTGEVARRLRATLRDADLIGQRADESWIALLPETDVEGARIAVERALENIRSKPVSGVRDSVNATASAGVAEGRGDDTLDRVLAAASAALDSCRHAGGDRMLILAAPGDSHAPPGELDAEVPAPEPDSALPVAA